MDRPQVLDLYFVDARARLIDIAAFLDRLERAGGDEDFRAEAFRRALKELEKPGADRARRVLLAFSDPTPDPIANSPGKSACGAFPLDPPQS
jgi:hypothetical protein